jgi:hypothetical protein
VSKRLKDIAGWLHSLTPEKKERLTVRLARNILVHGDADDCITWTASLNNCGYGQFTTGTRKEHWMMYTHVLFWVLKNGQNVPEGMEIAHSCDVRHCINWRHLEAQTHRENTTKANRKRRSR